MLWRPFCAAKPGFRLDQASGECQLIDSPRKAWVLRIGCVWCDRARLSFIQTLLWRLAGPPPEAQVSLNFSRQPVLQAFNSSHLPRLQLSELVAAYKQMCLMAPGGTMGST